MAAYRSISAPPQNNKVQDSVNLRFPLQSYVGLVFFVQLQGLLPSPPGVEIRKWCDGQFSLSGKGDDNKNTAFDI